MPKMILICPFSWNLIRFLTVDRFDRSNRSVNLYCIVLLSILSFSFQLPVIMSYHPPYYYGQPGQQHPVSPNGCSTRVHHRNSDNTCSCNTYTLVYFSAVQRTSINGNSTDSSNSTSNSSSTTDSTITHYWKKCVAFYANSNPQD